MVSLSQTQMHKTRFKINRLKLDVTITRLCCHLTAARYCVELAEKKIEVGNFAGCLSDLASANSELQMAADVLKSDG